MTPGTGTGTGTGEARPAASGTAAAAARSEELEALEEQRDFLLRSLEDLDREHAAGDVDEHDYVALRDDYTARAARLIRRIERLRRGDRATVRPRSTTTGEGGDDSTPPEPAEPAPGKGGAPSTGKGSTAEGGAGRRPSPGARRGAPRWQRAAVLAGVVVFAVVAGLLVAQAAGRRETGETATGGIRQSTREQLNQAIALASQGRYDEAIALHDEVLERQPDNAEALAYKGWFQMLSGQPGPGMLSLIDAVEADPEYPDAHAFLAIGFACLDRPDAALDEIERLEALDPPPMIERQISGLRDDPNRCPLDD